MADVTPCPVCGTPTNRMHCSARCRNKAGERRRRGRRLAAWHPNGRPPCPGCGTAIPDAAPLCIKWCSYRCYSDHRVASRRTMRHAAVFGANDRQCGECGSPLGIEDDGHKKFCTMQCQQRSNRRRQQNRLKPSSAFSVQLAALLCGQCGGLFVPNTHNAQYCSVQCRRANAAARSAAAARQKAKRLREESLACKRCASCSGTMDHHARSSAKFCTASCRERADYQRTRDQHKAYRDKVRRRPEFRESNRGYAHRRRARKASALLAEITPQLLAARMSMFSGCWMCGKAWSEVEHVKPLDKDGPHILANLRPACGPCNRRKGCTWRGVGWAISLRGASTAAR